MTMLPESEQRARYIAAEDSCLTREQEAALRGLCAGYDVVYNPDHYRPSFDLPVGWVSGWVGGKPGTIYVGVSPQGEANS